MLTNNEVREIRQFSKKIQMEVIKMAVGLPGGHIGGSLSVADVLAVLYCKQLRYDPRNPKSEDRDWLVVSKGHSGPAVYSALAMKGFFPMEQLKTLNQPHTDLPSHCDRNHTIGIDMSTGSLGQGGSMAAGVALGMKLDGSDKLVYLLMGDGELDEGQVWEMALFAATRKLDNLIAFVDYNKLQIDGRTDDDSVCNLGDVAAKFRSFGWFTQFVNGHDVSEIDAAIDAAKRNTGCPSVIVLDTEKGHGWSQTANQVGSHHRHVSQDDMAQALAEMQAEYETY